MAADMRRLIERERGPLPDRPERYRVFELVAWSKSQALEVGRLALRPGNQLEDPVPLRPVGQRAALALDEPPHVGGHRSQVERCTDQGVIQVEYAQTHALTVS